MSWRGRFDRGRRLAVTGLAAWVLGAALLAAPAMPPTAPKAKTAAVPPGKSPPGNFKGPRSNVTATSSHVAPKRTLSPKVLSQLHSAKLNRAAVFDPTLPGLKTRLADNPGLDATIIKVAQEKMRVFMSQRRWPETVKVVSIVHDNASRDAFARQIPSANQVKSGLLELVMTGKVEATPANLSAALAPFAGQVLVVVGHIDAQRAAFEPTGMGKTTASVKVEMLMQAGVEKGVLVFPAGCNSAATASVGTTRLVNSIELFERYGKFLKGGAELTNRGFLSCMSDTALTWTVHPELFDEMASSAHSAELSLTATGKAVGRTKFFNLPTQIEDEPAGVSSPPGSFPSGRIKSPRFHRTLPPMDAEAAAALRLATGTRTQASEDGVAGLRVRLADAAEFDGAILKWAQPAVAAYGRRTHPVSTVRVVSLLQDAASRAALIEHIPEANRVHSAELSGVLTGRAGDPRAAIEQALDRFDEEVVIVIGQFDAERLALSPTGLGEDAGAVSLGLLLSVAVDAGVLVLPAGCPSAATTEAGSAHAVELIKRLGDFLHGRVAATERELLGALHTPGFNWHFNPAALFDKSTEMGAFELWAAATSRPIGPLLLAPPRARLAPPRSLAPTRPRTPEPQPDPRLIESEQAFDVGLLCLGFGYAALALGEMANRGRKRAFQGVGEVVGSAVGHAVFGSILVGLAFLFRDPDWSAVAPSLWLLVSGFLLVQWPKQIGPVRIFAVILLVTGLLFLRAKLILP